MRLLLAPFTHLCGYNSSVPNVERSSASSPAPCCPSLLQVYGRNTVFDADRLIDLLVAFESFTEAAKSARGSLDLDPGRLDGWGWDWGWGWGG